MRWVVLVGCVILVGWKGIRGVLLGRIILVDWAAPEDWVLLADWAQLA